MRQEETRQPLRQDAAPFYFGEIHLVHHETLTSVIVYDEGERMRMASFSDEKDALKCYEQARKTLERCGKALDKLGLTWCDDD